MEQLPLNEGAVADERACPREHVRTAEAVRPVGLGEVAVEQQGPDSGDLVRFEVSGPNDGSASLRLVAPDVRRRVQRNRPALTVDVIGWSA